MIKRLRKKIKNKTEKTAVKTNIMPTLSINTPLSTCSWFICICDIDGESAAKRLQFKKNKN